MLKVSRILDDEAVTAINHFWPGFRYGVKFVGKPDFLGRHRWHDGHSRVITDKSQGTKAYRYEGA